MKKTAMTLTAALVLSTMPAWQAAAADDTTVTVTIANAGNIVVAMEQVQVTDIDGDGALTINDALYIAHEQCFEGGAAAGYQSGQTDWGLSLQKLWGVENGGSYGYTVNDASAFSLADAVQNGDAVYAYCYTDVQTFSDKYSYFDVRTAADAKQGDTVTLQLTKTEYDANWQPVAAPVSGAKITINGKETGAVTDADGKAEVSLSQSGKLVISAVSDGEILVPPVCVAEAAPSETTAAEETTATSTTTTTTKSTTKAAAATTKAAAAKTGDTRAIPALGLAGLLALGVALRTRRHP